jgi:23S rRNA (cytidine1920-2'-O)/16S rRNA (cytidine1409-2'-O)-methyltransferase
MAEGRKQGSRPATRADILAVEQGLEPSRARAAAEIRAGTIHVDGRPVAKPSELLPPGARLEKRGAANPYVSRAGLKLVHGLDRFGIDPAGAVALDLGASTGGFTEVMLGRGAAKVYAVDVGRGQMHPSLLGDKRVILMEGLNARDLTQAHIPEPVTLIVSDVSFISLTLVLPPALALAAPGAHLVVLIKPQFEAGPEHVRKGRVTDPAIHEEVCARIGAFLEIAGWTVTGLTQSPIKGGDGNTEFLISAQTPPQG